MPPSPPGVHGEILPKKLSIVPIVLESRALGCHREFPTGFLFVVPHEGGV